MSTFSFTTINNLPPAPANSSDPILTPRDDLSVCIPRYFDQEHFLDLFDRLYPFEYIEPMKDPGPGYEVFQMMAKVFERVSLAIGRNECCFSVSLSHGGYKARGTVEFQRPTSAAGAVTVRAGTVVRASVNSREFVLLDDVVFGATDLVVQGEVEAKQADSAFNLTGEELINGSIIEGQIDLVVLPLLEPPFSEPEISVRHVVSTDRGQVDCLGIHGKDRSILRFSKETDDEYRARILLIPDTIAPDALRRYLDSIFLPVGYTYDFIETWENRYQLCWDAPDAPIPNSIVGDVDPNLFVYDDPRDNPPFRNRWMDSSDHAGAIIVVVPIIESITEVGMVFDDPADTTAALTTSLGTRAHSAYDIPDAVSIDTLITLPSALDGDDRILNEFYFNIYDQLQKASGGGVAVFVELEGQ